MQRSHKFAKEWKGLDGHTQNSECTTTGQVFIQNSRLRCNAIAVAPMMMNGSSVLLRGFCFLCLAKQEPLVETTTEDFYHLYPSNVIYRNAQQSPKFFSFLAIHAHTNAQMPNCLLEYLVRSYIHRDEEVAVWFQSIRPSFRTSNSVWIFMRNSRSCLWSGFEFRYPRYSAEYM